MDSTGAEAGSDPITFRISRGVALPWSLTVSYTIGGSASGGTDYSPSLTGTVNIPAGESFADITLTPVDDLVDEADETVELSLVSGADYVVGAPSTANAVIADDDNAGIIIDPTSGLNTTEASGTAVFTVVLSSQPTADVTLSLSSSDPAEGTVSPEQVIFTAANWNTAQIVTVTGVDDSVDDGDISYNISVGAASTDATYSGLAAVEVAVTNLDDDAAGIVVNPTEFYMTEASIPQTYTITVLTQPSAPFMLALTFDPDQLSVNGSTTSPVLLTFTSGGTVSIPVDVVENDAFNTDRTQTIMQSIVSSTAPEYPTSMGVEDVTITISDAPPPPPVPTCEAHNFDEGGVVRSSAPDATQWAINCRVLYQNGAPTSWLGNPLYSEANLGLPGLLELGVQQAVDIFSPPGLTYFNDGAVFCLRGSGTLIWLAASGIPRHAEIIGSYEVDDFPGFTCVTLFEPGTLILVSDNPLD